MDKLFIIQLVSSFVFGGAFIAVISILAERASEKLAGLIISLPSTMAISFLFIGWTISPEKAAEMAPMLPAAVGVVMIFAVTYVYLSRINLSKGESVSLSVLGSLFVWFLLALPLAYFEFSNMLISLMIYLILTTVAYYFLTIKPKVKAEHEILKYSLKAKLFRAVFSGSIISLAVFLSKTLGPYWGGIFGMFPAVFLSTFIILHYNYDSNFLFKVWKNAPAGSIVFCIYAIAVTYTFPAYGVIGGTIAAYAVSAVVFILIAKLMPSPTLLQD